MWRRVSAAGLGLLGTIACAEDASLEIDLGAQDRSGLAIVVLLDEADEPTRVLPSLLLERGRLVAGERPDLALDASETGALALVIAEEDLDRALLGRLGTILEVNLTIEAPPPIATLEVSENGAVIRRATALPDTALMFRYDRGGARTELLPDQPERKALVSALKLAAVVDPEYCRSPFGPLEPYGAEEVPFNGALQPNVRKLYRVDERRAIFASRDEVFVVRRGETFARIGSAPGPRSSIPLRDLDSDPDTIIRTIAFGGPAASRGRVWVLVGSSDSSAAGGPFSNAVYELGLQANGLTIVGTSTRSFGPATRDLAIGADGELAMTADDEAVWFRDPSTGAWSRTVIPPAQPMLEDVARRLAPVVDDDISWMAGSRGRIHRFMKRSRTWDVEIVASPSTPAGRFTALTGGPGPEGPEYWAGDQELFRSKGRAFEVTALELPPSFSSCAELPSPYRIDHPVSSLIIHDGYLYGTLRPCWMVFAVRLEDLCVSLITRPEGANNHSNVYDVTIENGELLVGGDFGRIAFSRR